MSDIFEEYLSYHEPAFTTACESVLRDPFPEDAAYGIFWFQVDDTIWDRLPIALAWGDFDHGSEVQYPSRLSSLRAPEWSPPDGLGDTVIGDFFFRWIARCWTKAGGAESAIPFYCYNYHTAAIFCLRRGRYVTEDDIDADIRPTN